MSHYSRRTVLESVAAGIVGIGGVGTAAGQEDVHDSLEEMREAVREMRTAIENAVEVIEDVDDSGYGGADGSEVLDDVSDDLVVNGVPIGHAESFDDLNETAIENIDGELVVNDIPLKQVLENNVGSNNSTDGSEPPAPDEEPEPDEFEGFDPDSSESVGLDTQSSDLSDPDEFEGFDPDEDTDTSGSDGEGTSVAVLRANEAIEDIRRERTEAADLLDEIESNDSAVVQECIQLVRRLLRTVQQRVDEATDHVGGDLETAASVLETLEETVDQRAERLDEKVDEHTTDHGF